MLARLEELPFPTAGPHIQARQPLPLFLQVALKMRGDTSDAPWKEDSGYGAPAVWLSATCTTKIDLTVLSEEDGAAAALDAALTLPPPPPRVADPHPPPIPDDHLTNEEIDKFAKRLAKAKKKRDADATEKAEAKLKQARDALREELEKGREEAERRADEVVRRAYEEANKLHWRPTDVDDVQVRVRWRAWKTPALERLRPLTPRHGLHRWRRRRGRSTPRCKGTPRPRGW